ncbi:MULTISPECIES: class I SAM-dependent methyltransferase [unclassified Granulicatella]|uniref:class I SAM-dependent methyltransferase n=1 Tax=unclassified Granulicatella TaxID=2630493 RepID=UPI001072EF87|nr:MULTISPECIES: class I SAM-dependent methyltransferase [unclassified Granulicatella]MBF0780028.1 class I SAM-dependent methyltransferase [Granulicatella sp. 19428wC4_WM01]TFU95878.1 SAM-dependent methyltransferase [Granulicatella sp. WM01]
MQSCIVTTHVKASSDSVRQAICLAQQLNIPYCSREKRTIKQLMVLYASALIVYTDKLVYVDKNGDKLFFHPNTAMIRIKQGKEPLLELIGQEKQSILDLTMGLASDSIVMSHAGHHVIAIEQNTIIYTIVSHGLKQYCTHISEIDAAMRRIQTYQGNHLDFLKQSASHSVDVIYIDPMFSHVITESKNLDALKTLAYYKRDFDQVMYEAKRVARKQIILKAHYLDTVFEEYGFIRGVRKSAKFHFGSYRIE